MEISTEAIVLGLQAHSDKSRILHAYTRAGGRMSFMVYGMGKRKGGVIYQPLSLLRLTAQVASNRTIPTLREAELAYVAQGTMSDIRRQTVAIFLGEILFRTLRHPMADERLFDYIAESIRLLDSSDHPEQIHIAFMVDLAGLLGFRIDEETHPDLLHFPENRVERQAQLRALCGYFAEHIEDWTPPRSLDVLMEVFA